MGAGRVSAPRPGGRLKCMPRMAGFRRKKSHAVMPDYRHCSVAFYLPAVRLLTALDRFAQGRPILDMRRIEQHETVTVRQGGAACFVQQAGRLYAGDG